MIDRHIMDLEEDKVVAGITIPKGNIVIINNAGFILKIMDREKACDILLKHG